MRLRTAAVNAVRGLTKSCGYRRLGESVTSARARHVVRGLFFSLAGTRNSCNLSNFCLQDADGRDIRSINFYDDLAKWTAIEVIDGIG